ncbi:uncharacterized protein LOC133324520 [Musca vetustissima]|uniref:uncharacterized protein LOC133324520 n=1 Tax=Musca vetustissima TaxID=27455 RepID=UPI002AB68A49|nr:uncharacterized protein LOC133324520 [Musca vetustissima]
MKIIWKFWEKLIFLLPLLAKGLPLIRADSSSLGHDESCWLSSEVCNIRAELYQNLESSSNGIAMDIDCSDKINGNLENNADELPEEDVSTKSAAFSVLWQRRRFMGIQSVILDGCQTPLNTQTYGLEFLPICANVTKVALQHFHMDSLGPLRCDAASTQQLELEYLHLQYNEIASIDDDTFQGQRYPQLRILELKSNSLRVLQSKSLQPLRALEHLTIIQEPVLILKSADLFEHTAAISIHLVELKQMTSAIFRHLPETLQTLYVSDTVIENGEGGDGGYVELINPHALGNLTIARCALRAFTLIDDHSSLAVLNLHGNALQEFHAYENQLKDLDLSSNRLEYFPHEWLVNLTTLERLSLKSNRIHRISLQQLMVSLPLAHHVDLRENQLQSLNEVDGEFPTWQTLQMLRIKANHNPWDCLWLHDFAHKYPEKFRLLQYDKFISRINVNGLECVPAENPPKASQEARKPQQQQQQELEELTQSTASTPTAHATPATPQIPLNNISSFAVLYTAGGPNGDQWEFKRNQRAEALIIVFMLPLGIAFLFLLLYMWIYCQKMFHLSYYKNFSCVRNQVPTTSQRFDVVRQLPPITNGPNADHHISPPAICNDPGGYEVPLHGMCSECNCKSLAYANQADKCQKTVHITYGDTSPQELPHQIYEEIISVSDNEEQKQQQLDNQKSPLQQQPHHVHYDHLQFE